MDIRKITNLIIVIVSVFFIVSCRTGTPEMYELIDKSINNPDSLEFYLEDYPYLSETIQKWNENPNDSYYYFKKYIKEFKREYIILDVNCGNLHTDDDEHPKIIVFLVSNKDTTRAIEYDFIKYYDDNTWKLWFIDYNLDQDKMPTVGPF